MTEAEQTYFREKLEALEAELREALAQAGGNREHIVPDAAIGRLTRMEAIQSEHMTAEGRRRLENRLEQIGRALEQVERGTYGTCVRCGREIPRGRLEIMPETRRCVTCAARRR